MKRKIIEAIVTIVVFPLLAIEMLLKSPHNFIERAKVNLQFILFAVNL